MEPGYPLTSKRRRLPDEGDVEVFVADEQSTHPVDVARWQRLAEHVLDAEGVRGDAELSVLFVDEATIAELNQRFMGHDGPTDVLAFPLDDDLVGAGRWPDNGPTGPASNRAEVDEAAAAARRRRVCPAVAAAQRADARRHLRRRARAARRARHPPRARAWTTPIPTRPRRCRPRSARCSSASTSRDRDP